MVNFMLFDEGEMILRVIYLFFLSLIILVGFIVPIAAAITYAIYRIRMKYNFTWAKDLIEMEEEKRKQKQLNSPGA